MKKKHFCSPPRLILLTIFATLGLIWASSGVSQTHDLVHQVNSDSTLRILTQLQYSGSVIIDNAGQDEEVRVLPLDVRASLDYDQRISASNTLSPQAIRYFDKALATIKAGKGQTATELAASKRLVLARINRTKNGTHQFQIAAIGNTLSQQEYELLKNPGDPLSFAGLFDRRDIAIGDQWEPDKDQIADLLAVNRVISSTVSLMLKSVDSGVAKIYITGTAKAESDDANTDMNVKGIALLDIEKQLVTSLRMTIDEQRRAGQVAPGFEGTIKIDSRLAATASNTKVGKERLAELHQGKKVRFLFQLDRKDREFTLLHDSRWRIIASDDEAVVMRYLEDGQLIAQCNVVQLPTRPADRPLTLPLFQEEIRKITADSQARIVAADQLTTPAGLETLRVVVDGMESEIEFKWLYYHVAAADGRRVTFVFTHEKDAADYFQSADQTLVNSIEFKTSREGSQANRTGDEVKKR